MAIWLWASTSMQLYLSFLLIGSLSGNRSQNYIGAGFRQCHCLRDYMCNLFRIRDQTHETANALWSSKYGILSSQESSANIMLGF